MTKFVDPLEGAPETAIDWVDLLVDTAISDAMDGPLPGDPGYSVEAMRVSQAASREKVRSVVDGIIAWRISRQGLRGWRMSREGRWERWDE